MIPMTGREIAQVLGGQVGAGAAAAVVAAPVVVDSRLASAGSMFAAVVGEHADGHEFAPDAASRGATLALVARPVPTPHVVVPDVVAALAALATHTLTELRRAGDIRVVGITGSSGKTSTKDLVAQVLARTGDTVAPEGSFNNEIGLPLTVLRADRATRHLVLEMSARGVGHIAALCAIAPVDVGVVLNVGSAHVGEFGSREAIATAKAELVAGVVAGGAVVLNADDPLVAAMRAPKGRRVVMVGLSTAADVRADDVSVADDGCASFTLTSAAGASPVSLRLVGAHHVGNALAAAAVAMEAGLALADVAEALSEAVAVSRWRMEMRQTADGVTVINDAYNANPESMRAALTALTRVGRGRRTWAVLGPMAELGDSTDPEHRAVGRLCADLGVSHVVTVGSAATAIAEAALAAGVETTECADVAAAVALLRSGTADGDVVLVKASRSAGLERVAGAIAPRKPGGAA
ncbi:MAG TPA: UDP-N-acetylmuramoyl-tripeptide--D-alanyl-D-alanine ligase [Mycobacteriales bacterium]|nr:UDP-N-acetylmuramoyl-tripeptide--D-alanyl-D-alanine ligase [Mycobacteriales bacterium]